MDIDRPNRRARTSIGSPLRRIAGTAAVSLMLAAFVPAVHSAEASRWEVCASGCQYQDVGAAIIAAADGDTITIGPGVYPGGLTIDRSLRLVGAGASRTIIRGGGPVITIGVFAADTEPAVTIRGVTITGGVSRTSPISTPFGGQEGIWATGGGVEIPPAADFALGATTTIVDSVIADNRVAPSNILHFQPPCVTACQFAGGAGGGIDNWGNLTLTRTTVSGNLVGSASGLTDISTEADGAGIEHWIGDLTVTDSRLENNFGSVVAPNGQFADSGAIFARNGTLTMGGDIVRRNHVSVDAAYPDDADMLAVAGGVHVAGGITEATIRDTKITDNTVAMTNTIGYTTAFSGGLHSDIATVSLDNDDISRNNVISTTLDGSASDAQADSGAGEIAGTVTRSRFAGNSVTVTSAAGNVNAGAGAMIFSGTIGNSTITDNQVAATSPHGTVLLAGGGITAGDGGVTLRSTRITRNSITATATGGTAQGGGIYDTPVPDGPPGGPLVLQQSTVTANSITASSGVTVSGGGVYTTLLSQLDHSVIARNTPDQCVGC
jgi:hypothetical protein